MQNTKPPSRSALPILPRFLFQQETELLADGQLTQNAEDFSDPAQKLSKNLTPPPPPTHVV